MLQEVTFSPFEVERQDSNSSINVKGSSADESSVNLGGSSTVFQASFNFVNSLLGAGIIGIPLAIQQCGLIGGIFIMILVTYFLYSSAVIMIHCGIQAKIYNLEDVAEHYLGPWGYNIAVISMFLFAFGGQTAYLVILGDTVPMVARLVAPDSLFTNREFAIFFTATFIILPLCLFRELGHLAWTSLLSIVLDVVLLLVIALASYAAPISEDGDSSGRVSLSDISFVNTSLFAGIGTMSFALVCQHNSFLLFQSLASPTLDNWRRVAGRSLIFGLAFSLTLGLVGYFAFYPNVEGDILNNFPAKSNLVSVGRGVLAATMLFTYPMELYVTRHCLHSLLHRFWLRNQSQQQWRNSHSHHSRSNSRRRILLATTSEDEDSLPSLPVDQQEESFVEDAGIDDNQTDRIASASSWWHRIWSMYRTSATLATLRHNRSSNNHPRHSLGRRLRGSRRSGSRGRFTTLPTSSPTAAHHLQANDEGSSDDDDEDEEKEGVYTDRDRRYSSIYGTHREQPFGHDSSSSSSIVTSSTDTQLAHIYPHTSANSRSLQVASNQLPPQQTTLTTFFNIAPSYTGDAPDDERHRSDRDRRHYSVSSSGSAQQEGSISSQTTKTTPLYDTEPLHPYHAPSMPPSHQGNQLHAPLSMNSSPSIPIVEVEESGQSSETDLANYLALLNDESGFEVITFFPTTSNISASDMYTNVSPAIGTEEYNLSTENPLVHAMHGHYPDNIGRILDRNLATGFEEVALDAESEGSVRNPEHRQNIDDTSMPSPAPTVVGFVSLWAHLGVTILIWLATLIIALVAHKLGVISALTGSSAASTLGYTLPALLYFQAHPHETQRARVVLQEIRVEWWLLLCSIMDGVHVQRDVTMTREEANSDRRHEDDREEDVHGIVHHMQLATVSLESDGEDHAVHPHRPVSAHSPSGVYSDSSMGKWSRRWQVLRPMIFPSILFVFGLASLFIGVITALLLASASSSS